MLQILHYPKRILTFLLNKNTALWKKKELSVTECNGFISHCQNMAENGGFPKKTDSFLLGASS